MIKKDLRLNFRDYKNKINKLNDTTIDVLEWLTQKRDHYNSTHLLSNDLNITKNEIHLAIKQLQIVGLIYD